MKRMPSTENPHTPQQQHQFDADIYHILNTCHTIPEYPYASLCKNDHLLYLMNLPSP